MIETAFFGRIHFRDNKPVLLREVVVRKVLQSYAWMQSVVFLFSLSAKVFLEFQNYSTGSEQMLERPPRS